jgi:glycosyltransferase A (GT-A) superfamily protein (DUF2064 family)
MKNKKTQIPDPEKHLKLSLIKSAFRVLAGVSIVLGLVVIGGALLIAAEIIGIAEELV